MTIPARKRQSMLLQMKQKFNDQKEERVVTLTSSLDKLSVSNDRRLGGPHSRSGHCGAEKYIYTLSLPGIEPRIRRFIGATSVVAIRALNVCHHINWMKTQNVPTYNLNALKMGNQTIRWSPFCNWKWNLILHIRHNVKLNHKSFRLKYYRT
jgi:hypothetical protein